MTELFPYFDLMRQEIMPGEVYTPHPFCVKNFGVKCKDFYNSIMNPGEFICPFGFSTFVTPSCITNKKIYSSLLIQGKYDKKKIKQHKEQKNKFFEEELIRLVGICEADQRKLTTLESSTITETSLIRGILHEVRRLSREIESQRDELISHYLAGNVKATAIIENIYATTQLISKRIDSYELFKNPSAITRAFQPNINIYRKFDKARFVIDTQSIKRNIPIHFVGECHLAIEGYEIFDLLPYIFFDNAVKYTRPGMEVTVKFNPEDRLVEISNIGPMVKKEEINHIFNNSIRGEFCKSFEGSGLGLFMAKQIADLHKINCWAESSEAIVFHINEIPYSEFKIHLDFSHCIFPKFNTAY